jgi:hypothetical protein
MNTNNSTENKLETKEELIQIIKEWIRLDNDISKLNKELKESKQKQKMITQSLLNVMKDNSLDCFDINGGRILYKKSKVIKPINSKTLNTTLQKYFINNPTQAEDVAKFILENRENTVKETIRRKFDK